MSVSARLYTEAERSARDAHRLERLNSAHSHSDRLRAVMEEMPHYFGRLPRVEPTFDFPKYPFNDRSSAALPPPPPPSRQHFVPSLTPRPPLPRPAAQPRCPTLPPRSSRPLPPSLHTYHLDTHPPPDLSNHMWHGGDDAGNEEKSPSPTSPAASSVFLHRPLSRAAPSRSSALSRPPLPARAEHSPSPMSGSWAEALPSISSGSRRSTLRSGGTVSLTTSVGPSDRRALSSGRTASSFEDLGSQPWPEEEDEGLREEEESTAARGRRREGPWWPGRR